MWLTPYSHIWDQTILDDSRYIFECIMYSIYLYIFLDFFFNFQNECILIFVFNTFLQAIIDCFHITLHVLFLKNIVHALSSAVLFRKRVTSTKFILYVCFCLVLGLPPKSTFFSYVKTEPMLPWY